MTTKRVVKGAALLLATLASTRAASAQAGLTIYNQNFGVVRDTVPLNLQKGENAVSITDTTALLEPDSVVLRDPSGKRTLRVLEQNFRADALSQDRLLTLSEGKTIDFLINRADGTQQIVQGKVIRSSFMAPPPNSTYSANGYYYLQNGGAVPISSGQPIIEVDGKLRFQLPGVPLFPSLGDDTILKPQLNWKLATDEGGPVNAEISYVTGGMTWDADYNVVAPENGDVLDLTAWVTLTNNSGKDFPNARIQLMAGDVQKVQPNNGGGMFRGAAMAGRLRYDNDIPSVTQKDFDEYHLYTLARASTLRDRETKQVEFARAPRVASKLIYVYNGAFINPQQYNGWSYESIRTNSEYGTQSNTKVAVMREFVNNAANGLGIPLPKGRVRFYRRESDGGALQFVGENVIDHTPQGETVRVNTGSAFDIVGKRTRTDFRVESQKNFADESFEITLRNRKKTPVEVRVVEPLYRWTSWDITAKSMDFTKTDSQTIEFRVPLAPDEEKKITYTVRYSW